MPKDFELDFESLKLFLKKSVKVSSLLLISDLASERHVAAVMETITNQATATTKAAVTVANFHLVRSLRQYENVEMDPLVFDPLSVKLVQDSILVIDSLDCLANVKKLQDWYQDIILLQSLAAKDCTLVFLYRSAPPGSGSIKSLADEAKINNLQVLKDLAQCHIDLTTADFLLKKKSGKLFKSSLLKIEFTKSQVVDPTMLKDNDPVSSFNLSLTDTQRAQKDGMVLPYVLKEKESVIDYIADKQDDFDSDDLDDDLDI